MKSAPRFAFRLPVLLLAAAVVPACGGSSGGGEPATGGGLRIVARGGNGTADYGGSSGGFGINMRTASDVQILRSGSVNASVTVPLVMPDLGSNRRTITGSVTLTPDAVTNRIPGDNPALDATGLWVKPGATLTLKPNVDSDFNGTREEISLLLSDGVYIEGTVRADRKDAFAAGDGLSNDTAEFEVTADNVVITSTGRIDTSGADFAAGTDGGNAGWVGIVGPGTLVNAGTIDAHGGDGDVGGVGGVSDMDMNGGIYNTGTIDASGGRGLNGVGGAAANEFNLDAWTTGGAFNLGTMRARGGDGTAGGGNGGRVEVYAVNLGAVVSGGTIDTSGGSATVTGAGGAAGEIWLLADSGQVRAAGVLTARGGTGIGGIGGSGSRIRLETGPTGFVVNRAVSGGIYLGASIDTSGGDGTAGGDAGRVFLSCDYRTIGSHPGVDPIVLAGYGSCDLSGGEGATDGGSGGNVGIGHYGAMDDNGNLVAGSILNEADWILRGGRGWWGGGGGEFRMGITPYNQTLLAYEYNVPAFDRTVTNRGAIDCTGGEGSASGGMSSGFYLYDYFKVVNTGAIVASGGTAGTGTGGSGGPISIRSDDVASNSASITADGGTSGSGTGGSGQYIHLYSRTTSTSGNLNCRGGGSGSGTGGSGGVIDMFSTENGTARSGTFSVAGGAGATAGAVGSVIIDGVDLALTDGLIGF